MAFKLLEMEGEQAVRTHGQHLAATEALRQSCRESGNPVGVPSSVVGRYVSARLEGYMAGREASLLQEQERTQRTLQRAQERQDR